MCKFESVLTRFSYRLVLVVCWLLCSLGARPFPKGGDTVLINRAIQQAQKATDPDISIRELDSLYHLSVDRDFADGAFVSLMSKGIRYFEKDEYENARAAYSDAMPWARKSTQKDAVAWVYNNIGDAYVSEGEYVKASDFLYRALAEIKRLPPGPYHTAANIYNNLGIVNQRLNLPGKALEFYDLAEQTALSGKLDYQLANAYELKGSYYIEKHQPDSARKYFELELSIGTRLNRADLKAFVNYQLGNTYIEYGNYAKAAAFLETAIVLATNEYNYVVIDARLSLGELYRRTREYRKAEQILLLALADARAHNMKDYYLKGYAHLIDVYRTSGDLKNAVRYMDTLAAYKDTLVNSEKAKAIIQIELRTATEAKDRQLAENKLLIAQQQAKIFKKNVTIGIIAFAVILTGLLLLMLIFRQRHKEYLQAEQIKILKHENTISMLNGVIQGEENERTRLAKELHDGIGGKLAAAIMQLSSLGRVKTDGNEQSNFDEGMELLDDVGKELRETAHNLMPEVLRKQTLDVAVGAFCRQMDRGGNVMVQYQHFGDFIDVSEPMKLNTYRIVQELLRNAVRHAGAKNILVELLVREHTLTITIEDDGSGFDRDKVQEGVGLKSLASRVQTMNGHYSLESEPGRGTSVHIELEI